MPYSYHRVLLSAEISNWMIIGLAPDQGPCSQGEEEPDQNRSAACGGGAQTIANHELHAGPGIEQKRDGTGDHRARFEGGVSFSIQNYGQAERGQGDRRGSAKKTGEAFGLQDVSRHSKQGHYEATHDEAINVLHGPH